MQLERRRVRSDLIKTFKIMNGMYDINCDLFFQLDEGDRNCLRKDSDLILRNMLLVPELLITGTRYLQIVFIVKVKLFILLRSISHLHWNQELFSEVRRYHSRQYTAKACAYLCRHCLWHCWRW